MSWVQWSGFRGGARPIDHRRLNPFRKAARPRPRGPVTEAENRAAWSVLRTFFEGK